MTLALRWTHAARQDLLDIWTWRGRERPEAGDQILERIEAACARLMRFPLLGPAFPRVAPEARKVSIDMYMALYRIDGDAVVIVRVIDQRRLLESIKFEDK